MLLPGEKNILFNRSKNNVTWNFSWSYKLYYTTLVTHYFYVTMKENVLLFIRSNSNATSYF